jgi:hypothetical protein
VTGTVGSLAAGEVEPAWSFVWVPGTSDVSFAWTTRLKIDEMAKTNQIEVWAKVDMRDHSMICREDLEQVPFRRLMHADAFERLAKGKENV